MKEFVLILLLGGNTSINGPDVVSGFSSERTCTEAGAKIIEAIGDRFDPASAHPISTRYSCIEITK